ncbi:MAG: hypothetical protein JXC33_08495 [Deltaproteobacteria bacterium]|nr:hypothetical protein [Deltaproteobacteria bacterium]
MSNRASIVVIPVMNHTNSIVNDCPDGDKGVGCRTGGVPYPVVKENQPLRSETLGRQVKEKQGQWQT